VTSDTGESWTEQRTGPLRSFYDVVHANDTFVAVGASLQTVGGALRSQNVFAVSTNGRAWTYPAAPAGAEFYSVTHGQDLFAAVGVDNGALPLPRPVIYTSADGTSWTRRTVPPGNFPLWSVVYGAGRFVAVAENTLAEDQTKILTSTNGANWTRVSAGTAVDLVGVAFGGGRFVAVGYGGTIVSSTDGTNWTVQPSRTAEYLSDIIFGGSQFVAVGSGGMILTSPDGSTWTTRDSGTGVHLFGIAFENGIYAVAGSSGSLLISFDAVKWGRHPVPTEARLRGVAFGNNSLVTVGDFGSILQSGPSVSAPALMRETFASLAGPFGPTSSSDAKTQDIQPISLIGTQSQGSASSTAAHRIAGLTLLPDRSAQLSLTATPAPAYRDFYSIFPLETSTDLKKWEPLEMLLRTNRLVAPPLLYLDSSAAGSFHRFYRTPAGPFDTVMPLPTGPARVGTFVRQLTNPRNPVRQSFMASVWYPAQPRAGTAPGRYMDPKNAALWASVTGFVLFRDSYAHADPGAPFHVEASKLPVILYSPGYTNPRSDNTEKCLSLASHGFVVVALDSPYTQSWVLENGRLVFGDHWDPLSLDFTIRVSDAQFVVDELARWNESDPLLAGRLDLQKIGMFGFSFGGAVTAGLSQIDSRVKACAFLDGGGHPDLATVRFNIPAMILVGSDSTPTLLQARKYYRALFDRLSESAYFVGFRDAAHGSFADYSWFMSPPVASQLRLATSMRAYIVSFFNKHLRNLDDHLLDALPTEHPDVDVFLEK
jgi:dienelactone hydrolase